MRLIDDFILIYLGFIHDNRSLIGPVGMAASIDKESEDLLLFIFLIILNLLILALLSGGYQFLELSFIIELPLFFSFASGRNFFAHSA